MCHSVEPFNREVMIQPGKDFIVHLPRMIPKFQRRFGANFLLLLSLARQFGDMSSCRDRGAVQEEIQPDS